MVAHYPHTCLEKRVRSSTTRPSLIAVVVAVIATSLFCASVAMAQSSDAAASTPKQIRKAQRKAARAKKNAELKELEKNGYQPGANEQNYPADIQNAEQKANAAKAVKPAPASTP